MPKKHFLPKGIKTFLIGRKRGIDMKNTILPHEHNTEDVSRSIQKELTNIEKFQLIADIFKATQHESGFFGFCVIAKNV